MATNVELRDNWQSKRSALQCNAYMFDNSMATDVTFLVSNTQNRIDSEPEDQLKEKSRTIKAHKYILASRSPVFWTMFHGKLSEKESEIIINDVDPDALSKVFRYMYTDEIKLTPELVMFILYIAKKYMLTILRTKCTEYLEKQLCPENSITLLDQSLFFDEKELTAKILRVLRRQTALALGSSSIVHIRKCTLDLIVSEQNLTAEEILIFQACQKWATQKCEDEGIQVCGSNMRRMLGETLDKIRFPIIPIEAFSSTVVPSKILPATEEAKLFRYMAHGSSKSKKDISYSFEQRFQPGQSKTVLREIKEEDIEEINSMSFSLEFESESCLNIQGLYICDLDVKHVNGNPQSKPSLTVSVTNVERQLSDNSKIKEDVEGSKYIKAIRFNHQLTGKKQSMHLKYECTSCAINMHCTRRNNQLNSNSYESDNCPYCGQYDYTEINPECSVKLPILKKSEIILTDNFVSVKIKNKENNSRMPIVGLIYTL